jgi:hypothetical protein
MVFIKNKKVRKFVLLFLFLFSIFGNLLFFFSSILFDFNIRRINQINWRENTLFSDVELFRSSLVKGAKEMLRTGMVDYVPQNNGTIRENLEFNLKGFADNSPLSFYANGWLLWVCVENANNKDEITECRELFREKIQLSSNFSVDQALFGVSALRLYEYTQNVEYLMYADSLYGWLKSHDTNYGIPYNVHSNCNLIDGLGMFNPFFIRYSKVRGCEESYNLALKQIDVFAKYCCDKETGIPSHGFLTERPYLKVGSANWGRGCGWFAMGLLGVDYSDLNEETRKVVDKFDNSVRTLYIENKFFTQFIGQQGDVDLSATLPLIYYLKCKKLISLNEKDILEYSKYCHDGYMYNSSGDTESLNRYNRYMGGFPLTQAIMAFLCMDRVII